MTSCWYTRGFLIIFFLPALPSGCLCSVQFSLRALCWWGWSSPRSACGRRHLNVERLTVLVKQSNPVISSWGSLVCRAQRWRATQPWWCVRFTEKLFSPYYLLIVSRYADTHNIWDVAQSSVQYLKGPAHSCTGALVILVMWVRSSNFMKYLRDKGEGCPIKVSVIGGHL